MAFFSVSPECTEEHHVLALGSGRKIVLVTVTGPKSSVSVKELSVTDGGNAVLCVAVSPSNKLVAACTDSKTLAVWQSRRGEEGGVNWAELGRRILPKRAMVLCFTNDDTALLVGDKTGEAYLYSLTDWTGPGGHLLGHFSMLLDMVLLPSNHHVITCDRDEKIRVSKFPNSYNIECFCLAHTDFVSSMCLCPMYPNLLLSSSGDGTVKVWEWITGRLLGSEMVGRAQEDGENEAVTKVCCSSSLDPPLVVAAIENVPRLVVFSLLSDSSLSLWGDIQLSTAPWDITFDWSDHLWVCLNSQPEPVVGYCWKENKLSAMTQDASPLLTSLCKWTYFEDVQASTKDWSQMRKHRVDNMEAYLTRKEERLGSKKLPLAASLEQDTVQDDNTTPQSKKCKLEL